MSLIRARAHQCNEVISLILKWALVVILSVCGLTPRANTITDRQEDLTIFTMAPLKTLATFALVGVASGFAPVTPSVTKVSLPRYVKNWFPIDLSLLFSFVTVICDTC